MLYFAALQPLARLAVALRRRRGASTSCRRRRTANPTKPVGGLGLRAEGAVSARLTWTWSTTKGADLIVGADRVRPVVPHGVLAHLLRHGVLHLPPVRRAGTKLSRPIAGVGRQDAAGRGGRARPLGAQSGAISRRPGSVGEPPSRHLVSGDHRGQLPAAHAARGRSARSRFPSRGTGAIDLANVRVSASPGTTAPTPSIDAPAAALLRHRHALQPRRTRVPGQGFPGRASGSTPTACTSRATSRCRSSARRRSSWSRRRRSRSPDVRLGGAVRAVHRTRQPRRLLPRHLPRSRPQPASAATTSCCSTRARPKAAATGPGHFVGTSFIFSHNANLQHARRRPALLLRRQP